MSLTVSMLLDHLKPASFSGNKAALVTNVVSLDQPEQITESDLCWISEKNQDKIASINAGTVICPESIFTSVATNGKVNLIAVEKPRLAFMQVLRKFFSAEDGYEIAVSAQVHPSVFLTQPVFIGHNVVIEKGVAIGAHSRIGSNTVIKANTQIGNSVIIGSNCTIGGTGFGFEKNEEGTYEQIPHIGNVVIEDNVEIGNNTCIDRAVLGSTLLKKNSKVDNLVHIAHGAVIGENALIIAHAMVAGSATIGDGSWIAPCAAILNKITVGKNVTVGMGAVVLKSVEDNSIMVGNPAKRLQK